MSTPSKRGPKKWPKWKAQDGRFYSDVVGGGSTMRIHRRQRWYIESDQLDAMAGRMARAIKMSAEIHVGSGADHLEEARAAQRSIGLSPQRAPASAAAKKGKL